MLKGVQKLTSLSVIARSLQGHCCWLAPMTTMTGTQLLTLESTMACVSFGELWTSEPGRENVVCALCPADSQGTLSDSRKESWPLKDEAALQQSPKEGCRAWSYPRLPRTGNPLCKAVAAHTAQASRKKREDFQLSLASAEAWPPYSGRCH